MPRIHSPQTPGPPGESGRMGHSDTRGHTGQEYSSQAFDILYYPYVTYKPTKNTHLPLQHFPQKEPRKPPEFPPEFYSPISHHLEPHSIGCTDPVSLSIVYNLQFQPSCRLLDKNLPPVNLSRSYPLSIKWLAPNTRVPFMMASLRRICYLD